MYVHTHVRILQLVYELILSWPRNLVNFWVFRVLRRRRCDKCCQLSVVNLAAIVHFTRSVINLAAIVHLISVVNFRAIVHLVSVVNLAASVQFTGGGTLASEAKAPGGGQWPVYSCTYVCTHIRAYTTTHIRVDIRILSTFELFGFIGGGASTSEVNLEVIT